MALYVLLGLNVAAYGWQATGGSEHLLRSVEQFGLRPIVVSAFLTGSEADFVWQGRRYVVDPTWSDAALPFLSSMFLHGGLFHLLSNLWFLWIFADNVEASLGRLRFLAVYFATGFAAGATHVALGPSSPIPCVGASGAVSGILGAYLVFYPRARILTLIPLGFFVQLATLPAMLFLLLWFGLQILQAALTPAGSAGVAWWAHIGGFVAGAATALLASGRGPGRSRRRR